MGLVPTILDVRNLRSINARCAGFRAGFSRSVTGLVAVRLYSPPDGDRQRRGVKQERVGRALATVTGIGPRLASFEDNDLHDRGSENASRCFIGFRKASRASSRRSHSTVGHDVAASAAAGPVELNSQPSRLDELHSR